MKILYIADDRRASELATPALRTVALDVAIAWTSNRDDAQRWIAWNRDVSAVIAEIESDASAWASFIARARGLGVGARGVWTLIQRFLEASDQKP